MKRQKHGYFKRHFFTFSLFLFVMFLPFFIYKFKLVGSYSKKLFIEAYENNEWKSLIVPLKTSKNDENKDQILNRSPYSLELLHFLGLNSSIINSIDIFDDIILIFGSQTVIGTKLIQLIGNSKNDKKTLVIKIRSFVDIDFTSRDIYKLFKHLRSKISKFVIIYQPLYLFENSEKDGSKRIEELISIELNSIQKFSINMNIKPIFVIPPPHFKIYETVLVNSTTIFTPNLIDTENIQDPKNLLNKIIFQCKMGHKSEIVYYKKEQSFDFISVLPVSKVAHFIYSNFINDFSNGHIFQYINKILIISSNEEKEYSEMSIEDSKQIIENIINNEFEINCQIDLKMSPHETIEFIDLQKVKKIEIETPKFNEHEIKEIIHSSIQNLFYITDKPYLSIVFTGRNDDYGKGFIDRAKYFFNYLHKTVKNLRNIVNIELIVVDYATEKSRDPLHSLFSDYLIQLKDDYIFNNDNKNKIKIRFIRVPQKFHKKLNSNVPFLEYVAKNIGIRRANGEFVLSMNPDSILSQNFFELVSNKFFNPGFLYTSTRIDMKKEDSIDIIKKENFIHTIFEEPQISSDNTPKNPFSKKRQKNLMHQNCYNNLEFIKIDFNYRWGFGDFQMLSRKMWDAINGFNQFPSNTYVDNLLFAKMLKIRSGAFVMNLPTPIVHQYHDHVSSKRPHNIDVINNSMIEYEKYGRIGKLAEYTDVENWGFPDIDFDEVIYVI